MRLRRQNSTLRQDPPQALKGLLSSFPLTTSLVGVRPGIGPITATYSRATAGYFVDYEGVLRLAQTGEARFWGARRVKQQVIDSQNLASANWTATNVTQTGGQPDPFGANNATLLASNATVGVHRIFCTSVFNTNDVVSGNTFVSSVYAKAGTVDRFQLSHSVNLNAAPAFVNFSLRGEGSVLLASGSTAGTSYGIKHVGNGWYRCWVAYTLNAPASGATMMVLFINSDTAGYLPNFGGSVSDTLYFAYAQSENVTGASVFTPSEYVNYAGDYGVGITGTRCLDTVRLHTQNFLSYSEDFTQTVWTNTLQFMSIAPAVGVLSPDGLQAQAFVADTSNNAHRFGPLTSFPGTVRGGTFEVSVDVKAGVRNECSLRIMDPAFAEGTRINVTDINAMTGFRADTGSPSAASVTITDIGNGWRRLTVRVTFSASIAETAQVYWVLYGSGTAVTYIGTNSADLYFARPILRRVSPSILASYVKTGANADVGTDTGNTNAISPSVLLGLVREALGTQLIATTAAVRDLTDVSWTLGATLARSRTITSVDGLQNFATRLTGGAVAGTNTLMQPALVLAAASRTLSFYMRRVTGTGAINLTQDNGATWTDISAQLNGSQWTRVFFNANVLNPQCGIQVAVNGDAVDVDFAQYETPPGNGTGYSTPMAGTGAWRNPDALSDPTTNNFDNAEGSAYIEAAPMHNSVTAVCLINVNNEPLVAGSNGSVCVTRDNVNGNLSSTGGSAWSTLTPKKYASSWKQGTGKRSAVAAGGTLATDALFTTFAPAGTINFGANGPTSGQHSGTLRNLRIYAQQLPDAQLTAMVA